ncbi:MULTISPECIES: hypothetical protein [Algibacter]|nr:MULTISPECIES: hypothetical protein [Algibacter]MDO7137286.1 hypothetical protein [Algibacter lectus]
MNAAIFNFFFMYFYT